MTKKNKALTVVEPVEPLIREIRGERIILDSDLARVYGVPTKRLNEQVRRNAERFPQDFLFRLTEAEADSLRSQIATSNAGRGGRRYLPYAFTEHGAIMAANVLNSPRAVQMSGERNWGIQHKGENLTMNTRETKPLFCLRYFGPEVNPDAPAMGAYRKNKFK